MIFEYCETWPTSANLRTFILNHVEGVARKNPHVEIVVKQRLHREPIVRGLYLNTRDKVIDLKGFEVTGIQKKVELLLDSSGAKIKPFKGSRVVESTTEAARGIWSGLHVDVPYKI
jgi:large subunit ribosomal protein L43